MADPPAATQQPPDRLAERDAVERAMRSLPADQALAVHLRLVEDYSFAEVARLMGIPEGTVKSRAYRARRLLRAALGGRPATEGGPR